MLQFPINLTPSSLNSIQQNYLQHFVLELQYHHKCFLISRITLRLKSLCLVIQPRIRKSFTTIYGFTVRPCWPSWVYWCSSASSPSVRPPHWSFYASSSPSYPSTSASDSTGTVLISCGKFCLFHTFGSFLFFRLFSSYMALSFVFFIALEPSPILYRQVQESDNRNRLVPEKKRIILHSFGLYCPAWHRRSCLQASVNVLNIYHVVAGSQHTRTNTYCCRLYEARTWSCGRQKERRKMAAGNSSLFFRRGKKWIHWRWPPVRFDKRTWFFKKKMTSRPSLSQKAHRR